jgi:hypothetical protein
MAPTGKARKLDQTSLPHKIGQTATTPNPEGRQKAMSDILEAGQVRIHIDREPYHSPNPTTGHALYALAGISEHRDLFREVGGDTEDKLVPRQAHDVRLTTDEHFYSQRVFAIIVNTEPKEVEKRRLSFDDLVFCL